MSSIDDFIEEITMMVVKKFEKDFDSTANYSTKIMKKEAINMYNSLITQFYKYHTKSYIRHWEFRPGTEQGQNLYHGLHVEDHHSGNINSFKIKIDGSDVEGGYEYHSTDEVMDFVANGIRFTADSANASMIWRGSYNSTYFNVHNVTLKQAFQKFFQEYDDIYREIFLERWYSLGWGGIK